MAVTQSPFLMPAEWEPHAATWIAWPHHEPDWPGRLEAIPWVYAEIVRVLHAGERVEILCPNDAVADAARACLTRNDVDSAGYGLHIAPTDRVWLRDSGPTAVRTPAGAIELIHWGFNAWAKYDNYADDVNVPLFVEQVTGLTRHEAVWPDDLPGGEHGAGKSGRRIVLEGGGIETDGAGTLLVSEEWLLSDVQVRNPGRSRAEYERAFSDWLGIRKTIWLGCGCVGDDTHGHIDDIARFVAPGVVVLAYEPDPADENHAASADNLRRLERARDADGRSLQVMKLPMPRRIMFDGVRLPASYANFYIANGVVIVPTFNDPNDREVLAILADLFPDRRVIGIHCLDLVWGFGTLHCLTQQQPR